MIYCENIVKLLYTWQLFFLLIHRFHDFFFSIFDNRIATIAKTIFFFLFRQWRCRNCLFFNWTGNISGRGISVTVLPKFNKNEEREKEKGGERKQRNFGNTVTEIPLPKMLPVQLKKKAIATTPLLKKEKKKKLVWQLWQCDCRKWKKKNYEICEWVKKKVVTYTIFLQYFHNKSHVINYY